jgi:hypothetical protein
MADLDELRDELQKQLEENEKARSTREDGAIGPMEAEQERLREALKDPLERLDKIAKRGR